MNLSFGGAATASLVEHSRQGNVFCSYSTGVTSLPAYTATALGPMIWNGNTQNPQLKAVLIGISVAVTTASGAAVSVGLVWGKGQTTPLGATTAATLTSSTLANGNAPTCSSYISATVKTAGIGYMPLVSLPTTAITALPLADVWIPLDGSIIIPQGSWVALAAGATATSAVLDVAMVWAEVKY